MNFFLRLLVIALVFWGLVKLFHFLDSVKKPDSFKLENEPAETRKEKPAEVLPGLPSNFEPSLEAAQKEGAAGLRRWLEKYRSYVQDPRLASIELDYVVLVGASNREEARRVFRAVKQRVPPSSPVYPRVKKLEGAYN
jgi:hypothetical protein